MRTLLRGAVVSIFLVVSEGANAMGVCTNADAAAEIVQLQNIEETTQFSTESPNLGARAQRQAIIGGILSAYCSNVDATPQSDDDQKLNTSCALHSGVMSSGRVYWVTCKQCGDPGVECE